MLLAIELDDISKRTEKYNKIDKQQVDPFPPLKFKYY